MEQKYPDEYRGLELPYVAMTIVVPLLKSHLRSWECLEKPHLNLDEFLKWQNLLKLSDYNGPIQPDPMDPFHTLLWECLMPMVRQSIMIFVYIFVSCLFTLYYNFYFNCFFFR